MGNTTPAVPADKLEAYETLVATNRRVERKGAAMPYTSVNGHMFSFLTKTGTLALRLPTDEREVFLKKYKTRLCEQHGTVLEEYVEVPDALLKRTRELREYFDLSYAYVASLKPKPTRRSRVRSGEIVSWPPVMGQARWSMCRVGIAQTMYLRDLAVYASDLAEFPQGFTCGDFNLSTHTPVEAYLELLPRRKVVLGDLAKVNVVVGPRPHGAQAYFATLNVAIFYWPRFDFGRYFCLSREGQQRRIVAVLHKTLLRIARRTNSGTRCYQTAFAALALRSFPLPEITELELRRRTGLLSPREKSAVKRRARKASRTRP